MSGKKRGCNQINITCKSAVDIAFSLRKTISPSHRSINPKGVKVCRCNQIMKYSLWHRMRTSPITCNIWELDNPFLLIQCPCPNQYGKNCQLEIIFRREVCLTIFLTTRVSCFWPLSLHLSCVTPFHLINPPPQEYRQTTDVSRCRVYLNGCLMLHNIYSLS
jgi:hypothetical protein